MLHIDFSKIAGFAEVLEEAPEIFADELSKAFGTFGKSTNEAIRADAASGLKTKSKGTAKAFKYKSSDISKINGNPSKVFVDFFSKWKAAEIFETGGTIHPATAQSLTILTDAARGSSGRRRWSPQQIVAMIHSGQLRLIKTPGRWLIVKPIGGLTKTGKPRKGTRDEIIAIIQRAVKETKRLNFFGTVEGKMGDLTTQIEAAIERTNQILDEE